MQLSDRSDVKWPGYLIKEYGLNEIDSVFYFGDVENPSSNPPIKTPTTRVLASF